jgi:hypothetical protein
MKTVEIDNELPPRHRINQIINNQSSINWQPIETAPKDRRILLYFPDLFSDVAIYCGGWYDDSYNKRPRPYWSADCESWAGKNHLRAHPPTHWAELTPPRD